MSAADHEKLSSIFSIFQNATVALESALDGQYDHPQTKLQLLLMTDRYSSYWRALQLEQRLRFDVISDAFSITIENTIGQKATLNVDGNTMILDVCRKLEVEGFASAPLTQKLIFEHMCLQYDRVLSDYAIDGTKSIYLIPN